MVFRGFFPKGGGEVRVTTEPVKFIRPVNITEVGHLTRITGRAFTAGVLPVKVTFRILLFIRTDALVNNLSNLLIRYFKQVEKRMKLNFCL